MTAACVSFGQSSGPVPDFKITLLAQKGSLYATRPSLANYTASRKDLVATANDLFEVVGSGKVKVSVNRTYPLADAARAHQDLEARLTTGSTDGDRPIEPCPDLLARTTGERVVTDDNMGSEWRYFLGLD